MTNITMPAAGPIVITAAGSNQMDGSAVNKLLIGFARMSAKQMLSGTSALTDNSGGAASGAHALTATAIAAGAAAAEADKTTTEAALGTVLDAVRELWTKATAAADKLGIAHPTYSGGGAAADGTIAAVTVSVTSASTGVPVAAWNATRAAIDNALYGVGVLTNKIATATGTVVTVPSLGMGGVVGDISAISTSLGAAVSPSTAKAEADAALAVWRGNIATVASVLNTALGGLTIAPVIVQ